MAESQNGFGEVEHLARDFCRRSRLTLLGFRFFVAIHFPVVAYPKNRILVLNSFVFLRQILYSHSRVQFFRVVLEMLHRSHGKGLIQESVPSSVLVEMRA